MTHSSPDHRLLFFLDIPVCLQTAAKPLSVPHPIILKLNPWDFAHQLAPRMGLSSLVVPYTSCPLRWRHLLTALFEWTEGRGYCKRGHLGFAALNEVVNEHRDCSKREARTLWVDRRRWTGKGGTNCDGHGPFGRTG